MASSEAPKRPASAAISPKSEPPSKKRPEASQFALSEVITVIVGEERKRFGVHKDILCIESDFFAGCLSSGMKEAESKQVELLNDRPEAFGLILNCLYDSAFRTRAPATPTTTLDSLIHAWMLADRLLMESGQNAMMDVIQAVVMKASHDKKMVLQGLRTLQLMETKPARTSCLYRFLVHRYTWDMQNTQAHLTPRPNPKLISEAETFFECGRGIVVDVFNAFTWYTDKSSATSDPAFGRGCTYHEHKNGSEKACWRYTGAPTTPKPS
ncbi:hypothetical protein LTR70_005183 [Exophiala xenobiotica]|uniref:BTB domain-containing protein n=1 Tax=Lithohypha guttulata TaxID=1690604 RepID=A0ABR0KB52_9EURO|nr:hypothetical protein LTR24_004748 [Lithohypha guttulata]KAK5318887.1 hypothetical protein LTR70_005183 [Exophiala xenobiotica]